MVLVRAFSRTVKISHMFPADMLGVPEGIGPPDEETVEPQAKRAKAVEENEPEPGPEPGTGAGSSTDDAASPSLPLVPAAAPDSCARLAAATDPWNSIP